MPTTPELEERKRLLEGQLKMYYEWLTNWRDEIEALDLDGALLAEHIENVETNLYYLRNEGKVVSLKEYKTLQTNANTTRINLQNTFAKRAEIQGKINQTFRTVEGALILLKSVNAEIGSEGQVIQFPNDKRRSDKPH